ncbi:hypothetical protein [Amycolatopsis jiangsuensis]|uniref:Uncharacterized protein n=1 Tax=Amycolatopsis jiangsuensis TaxID=1181879 RepID=A0A840IZW4_9PSEU|nr:hypothetical protein [Amycolatopsis jiangsuensis]MBB4687039.1 hypothetical protein [Amycolatopsis jiangsuensis]
MTQDDNTGEQPQQPQERGSMRFQDGNTQPREPSLAEQRARRQALADREREEQEAAAARAVAQRKADTKRKVLIGGGVTVGLAGLISTYYTVAKPTETTAVCTDASGVVQNDQYCDESYAASHGGHYSGGFWFIPLPGGGFSQYRYNYGGTGTVGQRVSGGSFTAPSGNTNVSTKSGTSVQRGGFGISGKSGGIGGTGKSGGS